MKETEDHAKTKSLLFAALHGFVIGVFAIWLSPMYLYEWGALTKSSYASEPRFILGNTVHNINSFFGVSAAVLVSYIGTSVYARRHPSLLGWCVGALVSILTIVFLAEITFTEQMDEELMIAPLYEYQRLFTCAAIFALGTVAMAQLRITIRKREPRRGLECAPMSDFFAEQVRAFIEKGWLIEVYGYEDLDGFEVVLPTAITEDTLEGIRVRNQWTWGSHVVFSRASIKRICFYDENFPGRDRLSGEAPSPLPPMGSIRAALEWAKASGWKITVVDTMEEEHTFGAVEEVGDVYFVLEDLHQDYKVKELRRIDEVTDVRLHQDESTYPEPVPDN